MYVKKIDLKKNNPYTKNWSWQLMQLTFSQWRFLIPGFRRACIRGINGLKSSIHFLTCPAASWHAGMSPNCRIHLWMVLKESLTLFSTCSGSIALNGSLIQLSWLRSHSDVVIHRFLNGSKSLINFESLSYCDVVKKKNSRIKVLEKYSYFKMVR